MHSERVRIFGNEGTHIDWFDSDTRFQNQRERAACGLESFMAPLWESPVSRG
jgi:hypothetical protein